MSFTYLLMAAAEPAKNAFGPAEMLREGGVVTWAIFLTLVVMSIGSFYVLFTKMFEQNKVFKQYDQVAQNFWRAPSLEEGAAKLDKNSAYRQVVDDGIAARTKHGLLSDPVEAHDWLHGAMSRSEGAINNKLNGGLSFLATVGATAPFVGLLGTVIGIYGALIKIGIAGQASIDQVAGPVGEALIMTAIGLFVAVPAVFAYNWLQGRNMTIARQLEAFSNDVLGYITSDGKVKPTKGVAVAGVSRPAKAPAAKK